MSTEKAGATAAAGPTNIVLLSEASKGRKTDDDSVATDSALKDPPVALLSVSRSAVNRSDAVTAEMAGPFAALLVKLVSSDDGDNEDTPEEPTPYELSENALVLLQADLKTLMERGPEIIESYRTDRFLGIYLTECPVAPDVTTNEAIAVYERGNSLIEDRQIGWPRGADAASVADSLLDGIRSHTVSRVVNPEVVDW